MSTSKKKARRLARRDARIDMQTPRRAKRTKLPPPKKVEGDPYLDHEMSEAQKEMREEHGTPFEMMHGLRTTAHKYKIPRENFLEAVDEYVRRWELAGNPLAMSAKQARAEEKRERRRQRNLSVDDSQHRFLARGKDGQALTRYQRLRADLGLEGT